MKQYNVKGKYVKNRKPHKTGHTAELKRFNDLVVGRELRMVELKAEVNELCSQLGLDPRYLADVRNGPGHEQEVDKQSYTESAAKSQI